MHKTSLSLEIKSMPLPLAIFQYFFKIDKNLVKKMENVNKNNGISSPIKILNLDNSL